MFARVSSNGVRVLVGRTAFPATYRSFDAIAQAVESRLGSELTFTELTEIQALLGAFWPKRALVFVR